MRSQDHTATGGATSVPSLPPTQGEFWAPEPVKLPEAALERAAERLHRVLREYQPTHIVSMVSGGLDSAGSDKVCELLQAPVDLIMHGRTGTGIPQTTRFVADYYGARGPDFAIADAGDAYERYVMRKGFFGVGRDAHNYSYRILKADPFRATVSRLIRKRQRGVRVMLITGARRSESENRRLNLRETRLDKGNLWFNICHDWTAGERDQLLAAEQVAINPVAKALCRSGECMCGTMQSQAERVEAAAFDPQWGAWLDDLRSRAKRKFGFDWGESYPKPRDPLQGDLFEPLCSECVGRVA